MAVAETWLRGGRPLEETKQFADYHSPLTTTPGKDVWHVVTTAPSFWSTDSRHHTYYRPLLLMIFAAPSTVDVPASSITADVVESWRLIYLSDIGELCKEKNVVAAIHDTIAAILKVMPQVERPDEGVIIHSLDMTPPTIDGNAASTPLKTVSDLESTVAGLLKGVVPTAAAGKGSLMTDAPSAVLKVVDEVVEYAMNKKQKGKVVDASFPKFSHLLSAAEDADKASRLTERIIALSSPNSRLSHGEFRPKTVHPSMAQRKPSETTHTVAMKLEPNAALEKGPGLINAVTLLQRPLDITAEDPSVLPQGMDALEAANGNPARGSGSYPGGKGCEFHLHQDLGDAVHCARKLNQLINTDWMEDVLHSVDGEVFVHFGPFDGVHMDDLAYFSRKVGHFATSGLLLPKMCVRIPTGTADRRTPVENPHMLVTDSSLPSIDVLEAVVDALEQLQEHIQPAEANPDTLRGLKLAYDVKDEAPLGEKLLPEDCPSCAWCGRLRVKMSRCSRCKAVYYCCPKHQASDWKGRHKGECKLAAAAQADSDDVKAAIGAGGGAPTASASDAATTLHLIKTLRDEKAAMKVEGPRLVLHVVGIPCGSWSDYAASLSTLLETPEGVAALGAATDIRVLVAGDKDSEGSLDNAVYCGVFGASDPSNNQKLVKQRATGVLGDIWYEKGQQEENTSPMLRSGVDKGQLDEGAKVVSVRCCSERYHHFMSKFESLPTVTPTAILVLGGRVGEGMTFFSAPSEILQDYYGVVPIAICEATRVSCHRTLEALESRASMRSGATPDLPQAFATPIEVNSTTLSKEAFTPDAAGGGAFTIGKVHPNSFLCHLLPKVLEA